MIENCVAVVGEDVAALFDAFPPRCSTDGLGSGKNKQLDEPLET